MMRLFAIPLLFVSVLFVAFTADCWHSLRAEASHPIMSWGWRLAGYCFLAVFSVGAVVAFAAAIGYAFKVIP
jgi:hypothetical protein